MAWDFLNGNPWPRPPPGLWLDLSLILNSVRFNENIGMMMFSQQLVGLRLSFGWRIATMMSFSSNLCLSEWSFRPKWGTSRPFLLFLLLLLPPWASLLADKHFYKFDVWLLWVIFLLNMNAYRSLVGLKMMQKDGVRAAPWWRKWRHWGSPSRRWILASLNEKVPKDEIFKVSEFGQDKYFVTKTTCGGRLGSSSSSFYYCCTGLLYPGYNLS